MYASGSKDTNILMYAQKQFQETRRMPGLKRDKFKIAYLLFITSLLFVLL